MNIAQPLPDALPFDIAEYQARLTAVQTQMAARGLDVLFVTDPSNMAWLSGYDGWSFYVHQGLLVPASGPPHWWGRGMDAAGARRTVWMSHDLIHGYDDSLVQNPDVHPMSDLARRIGDLFPKVRRIGVEMDNYYYTAAAHAALTRHLADAEPIEATGLVNWQRAVKSSAEIAWMRKAGAIVTRMHQTIAETARPGMPKNQLIARILAAGVEGADGQWGDYPAIVPMAPSGADAAAPHLTWDGAPIPETGPTFFEIAGVARRYHAPQSRTLFFSDPPAPYRRAEAAIAEVTDAAITAARPGAVLGDVARAVTQAFAKHGISKDARSGYSIGLSYPPDWGERTMSIRSTDETVLQAGMCFHLMPGLWLDDGGIEITEPILITDTGAESLADTPTGLTVLT